MMILTTLLCLTGVSPFETARRENSTHLMLNGRSMAVRSIWKLPERLAGDTRPMIESMVKLYLLIKGGDYVNVDDVLNYGCWCQIGQTNSNFDRRHGRPVDILDRQCQNWARCYRCNLMDTDSTCEPMKQEYYVDFRSEVMSFVCDESKNNQCQQNTCLCDVELSNKIMAYLEDWDPFHSNNKGFSPLDQCLQGNNPNGKPTQCCGSYPSRYPWHDKEGERGCCGGKTSFNTNFNQCCADGTVKSIGQCSAVPVNQGCSCLNGGNCDNSGQCICQPGYTGPQCEWGPCAPNPCIYGTCVDMVAINGIGASPAFVCKCQEGWAGQFCQNIV